jgi:hypothetical protein
MFLRYFKKNQQIFCIVDILSLSLSAALKSVFSKLSVLPLLLRGEIVFSPNFLKTNDLPAFLLVSNATL